jgi:pimeloyl-ACP methyl ester carboxylesterase
MAVMNVACKRPHRLGLAGRFRNLVLTSLLLALLAHLGVAQEITNDVVSVTIRDERQAFVSLYIPLSLNNDNSERRLYGSPAGIVGMFETLHEHDRRVASYEAALRELALQPVLRRSPSALLIQKLQQAGVTVDVIQGVLELIELAPEAITGRYVRSGTLSASLHNALARFSRDAKAIRHSPGFAAACAAVDGTRATIQVADLLAGTVLLHGLATDEAEARLLDMQQTLARSSNRDPALAEALDQALTNVRAARSELGAFALRLQDELESVVGSALDLGASLISISAHLSGSAALWIGAPPTATASAPDCRSLSSPAAPRLPLLLVHGIWGGLDSWKDMAECLTERGWTEGPVISFTSGSSVPRLLSFSRVDPMSVGAGAPRPATVSGPDLRNSERVFARVVFEDNDGQTLAQQGLQVGAAVTEIRRWTGASKVVLAGHSMGGLAARAYLQGSSYRKDLAALVTIATPHLGSLLPYLAQEGGLGTTICRLGAHVLADKDLASVGARLLTTGSPELVALNSPTAPYGHLPQDVEHVSLVATYTQGTVGPLPCGALDTQDYLARWSQDLRTYFDPAKALSVASPSLFVLKSDGIVPVASQYLRIAPVAYGTAVRAEFVDGFHSDVTSDPAVWNVIMGAGKAASPVATTTSSSPGTGRRVLLLLDISGSMQGSKLDDAKEAARQAIAGLGSSDQVSLVTFGRQCAVMTQTDFTGDREDVTEAINRMDAEGGTPLAAAIDRAVAVLEADPDPASISVVLLSDGAETCRGDVLEAAARLRRALQLTGGSTIGRP